MYKLLYNRKFDIQYPSISMRRLKRRWNTARWRSWRRFQATAGGGARFGGGGEGRRRAEDGDRGIAGSGEVCVVAAAACSRKAPPERYVQEVRQVQDSATASYKLSANT